MNKVRVVTSILDGVPGSYVKYSDFQKLEAQLAEVATDRLTFLKRAEAAEEAEKGFAKTINHMSKRIKELEAIIQTVREFAGYDDDGDYVDRHELQAILENDDE